MPENKKLTESRKDNDARALPEGNRQRSKKNDFDEYVVTEPKKKSSRSGGKTTSEPIREPIPNSPRSSKFIHQFIPYILFVMALFFGACFICVELFDAGGAVGVIGQAISSFFCGVFGWPAFLIPLVLFNLAYFWRRYVDMNLVPLKLAFSLLILWVVSALVHVVMLNTVGSDNGFAIIKLWKDGKELHGGGALGGIFGEACQRLIGPVGSYIILIAGIGILFMFLFGTTPRAIMLWIRYKAKLAADRRRERAAAFEAEEAEKESQNQAKPDKSSRRDEKKSKEEERRRRHEILEEDVEQPAQSTVFTENHEAVVGESVDKSTEMPDEPPILGTIELGEGGEIIEKKNEPEIKPDEKPEKANGRIILEPVSGKDSKYASELESEEDFNELDSLLSRDIAPSEPKKASTQPSASKDDVTPKLTIIAETDDISDLLESDEEAPAAEEKQEYVFPPFELLTPDKNPKETDYSAELKENAKKLMDTLASFNVKIQEINYSRGPTITRYELKPAAGVRVRSIANLVDDIALNLATTGVRIEAPIPGKPAVGVEVPNVNQATVYLRSLIESQTFADAASRLAVCLGEDVAGKPIYFNIDKMPHLLIAGATGMGKSVCINSIIVSILYKATPDEVKLILIDPKKVEFNVYKEMPHLFVPVVSDPKKAAGTLATAVNEMERRFELIEDLNVRDITSYNKIAESDPDIEPLPRVVIVIDELADLMMTAPDDVETAICRIAQKARAAGMHLIIGTQRPSVDVITGLIKANVPSRIACTVSSQIDSRTIIDVGGAEKLIGRGDMLFAPVGAMKPMRVQGAFVSEVEVENVVEFIKSHNAAASYDEEFIKNIDIAAERVGNKKGSAGASPANIEDVEGDGNDPKLREAIELAVECGKISTSLMQRRLGVGYGRAAKILDQMEALHYISPAEGNKPRQVLITKEAYMEKVLNDEV